MKGSIRKRKNNAWSYRIDLGYVDGKRRQVEKGGFTGRKRTEPALCAGNAGTLQTGVHLAVLHPHYGENVQCRRKCPDFGILL